MFSNTGSYGFIDYDPSSSSGIRFSGFGPLRFGSNTNAAYGSSTFTEAMRITSTGTVGIGTTSPVGLLDVAGTAPTLNIRDTQSKTWAAGDIVGTLDFYSNDTSGVGAQAVSRIRSVADTASAATSGALAFWTAAAGAAATEKVRITSAGSVGIGTTSPSATLDVVGETLVQGRLQVTAASPELLLTVPAGGLDSRIYNDGSGNLIFGTGTNSVTPTERMRISAAGGLSIGDTTDPGAGGLRATGNVTLGDATTDTVTVNGYMGIGGAPLTQMGLFIANTGLTTTTQYGVYSAPTGTSAATSNVTAIAAAPATAASAATHASVHGLRIFDATKGAGSTITNLFGLAVNDLTQGTNNYGIFSIVSSGSNKWNFYASGTAANYMAGQLQLGDGSAATPALSNFGDENTGIFFPAADTIAFAEGGTESMRIDASGNLGVGTSSPLSRLDVADATSAIITLTRTDSTSGNGVIRSVGNTGVTNASINLGGGVNNNMVFTTNSAERMRIDSSGNLGLGVTPSAFGAGRWMQFLSTTTVGQQQNGTANLICNAYESSANSFSYIATAAAARYNVTAGAHQWFNAPSGTAGDAISFTQAMTLDASGRLLVGTTSGSVSTITAATTDGSAPANTSGNNALRLRSTATAAVGAGPSILFEGQTGNTTTQFGFAAIQGFKGSSGVNDYSGVLAFYTQNSGGSTALTERMRLDASGNLGIGTTSPSAKLEVLLSADGEYLRVGGGNVSTRALRFTSANAGVDHTINAASTLGTIAFATNSTERMRITSAGDIIRGATAGVTSSGGAICGIETLGGTTAGSSIGQYAFATTNAAPFLEMGFSRNATVGSQTVVNSGDVVGAVRFSGSDGTNFVRAAQIVAVVDGTPGTNDMPGRLIFATSADGSATPTERMRIDSAGNVQTSTGAQVVWAPAPASISTTATLTNANIQAQIINTTGTSYTVTMPLGTTLETLISWMNVDLGYDFTVINTASGTITMAVNTGVTSLGGLTIATGVSAQFRIRRTGANTFVLYRLS
jgi:hypothetical protein